MLLKYQHINILGKKNEQSVRSMGKVKKSTMIPSSASKSSFYRKLILEFNNTIKKFSKLFIHSRITVQTEYCAKSKENTLT